MHRLISPNNYLLQQDLDVIKIVQVKALVIFTVL